MIVPEKHSMTASVLLLIFSGLMLLAFLLVCMRSIPKLAYDDGILSDFTEGWYDPDAGEFVTLPYDKGTEFLRIEKRLPLELYGDSSLMIKTRYNTVRAYINEELINPENIGNEIFNNEKFNLQLLDIVIDESYAGNVITLEISKGIDSSNSVILDNISFGSHSGALLSVYSSSMLNLIFCLPMLTIAVAFLLFTIPLRKYKAISVLFLNLATATMLSVLWIITDAPESQFILSSKGGAYMLSFSSFMLLPIPFLFSIKGVCSHGKTTMNALAIAHFLLFVMNITFSLTGFATLRTTLTFTHILLIITIIVMVATCLMEVFKYKNTDMRYIFAGFCILCMFSLASLISYYNNSVSIISSNSVFFKYGLVLFIVCLSVGTLKKAYYFIKESTAAEAFKRLAFTDIMTGLSNRVAFERDISDIERRFGEYNTIGVIMFDLNNLKLTNDTLGHPAGDELICAMAKSINRCADNTFKPYRIGGDEFVVILTHQAFDTTVQEYIDKVANAADEYNNDHDVKLSYACGYSIYDADSKEYSNIMDIYKSADRNMYQNKSIRSRKYHTSEIHGSME